MYLKGGTLPSSMCERYRVPGDFHDISMLTSIPDSSIVISKREGALLLLNLEDWRNDDDVQSIALHAAREASYFRMTSDRRWLGCARRGTFKILDVQDPTQLREVIGRAYNAEREAIFKTGIGERKDIVSGSVIIATMALQVPVVAVVEE